MKLTIIGIIDYEFVGRRFLGSDGRLVMDERGPLINHPLILYGLFTIRGAALHSDTIADSIYIYTYQSP